MLLIGAAAAAVAAAAPLASPARAATLRMAWSQDATGLDPHKQTAFSSQRLLELVYEPLVRLDDKLEVVPAIAQRWAFSDDGRTLTFALDPKATFATGAPVTSADVKASFARVLDEKTGAAARANFTSIAAIDAPDPATVVFHLSRPDAPILVSMTTINAAVAPADAIAAGTLGTKATGSGPFTLDSWVPGARSALKPNPHWAGGKVSYDGIDLSILPDETAILASLRAGQTDFAVLIDPLVATLVPAEAKLHLDRAPGLSYNVLQLNPARAPMSDLKVRQAISCAVNRQEVVDGAQAGEGRVTGPLTMPLYASDPDTLFCYRQDVARAKRLLAEAGVPDGFSATVIAATGEPKYAADEAQVLQSQLMAVGIKLKIQMMELNVYVDRWLKGDFDMAVALNRGLPDPYPTYNRYFMKGGNFVRVSNYVDDTLDTLLEQGRVETDIAKRKDIFRKFEVHLAEVSPWIWLSTAYGYTAETNAVHGFVPSPTGSLRSLSRVTLDR